MMHRLRCRGGFTLIEIIGVLAIIAILAAMIAPNVIKQIQRASQTAEEGTLALIEDGLKNYILETKIIPPSGSGLGLWATAISNQTEVPVGKIATNESGCNRRYWFDAGVTPAVIATGTAVGGTGYDQNTAIIPSGAVAPTNVRAMIISDMSPACSNNIAAGATAAEFLAVWDQASGAVILESNTIKVQRQNLASLFEHISLQVNTSFAFARRLYNPTSTAVSVNALITIPSNSMLSSIDWSSGGIQSQVTATAVPDPVATAALVISGTTSGAILAATAITAGGGANVLLAGGGVAIAAGATDVISSTVTITPNTSVPRFGDVDVTANYSGVPQYMLNGQANPACIPATCIPTGFAASIDLYVINGTQLLLYDQGWTVANTLASAGNQLLSIFIKEAESFIYSPGPPMIWGR